MVLPDGLQDSGLKGADVVVERVEEYAEGQVALELGGTAGEHQMSAFLGARAQLGEEAGLADPGLPNHCDNRSGSPRHGVQHALERLEFGVAPDQMGGDLLDFFSVGPVRHVRNGPPLTGTKEKSGISLMRGRHGGLQARAMPRFTLRPTHTPFLPSLLLAVVPLLAAGAAHVAPPPAGALKQIAAPNDCISEGGAICGTPTGRGLNGPAALAVSPDGKNVYVASVTSDAVAVFSRDASNGRLTQLTGAAGCIVNEAFDRYPELRQQRPSAQLRPGSDHQS